MRCPSCNKFAPQSVDGSEPELSLDVDEAGNVTGSCRLVVTSECCGDELKDNDFDISIDYDGDENQLKQHQGDGHDLSIEDESAEATDEYQTKDRNGKPIKNPRYMRHLYGVVVTGKVKCSCGNFSFDFEFKDDVPASGMNELI